MDDLKEALNVIEKAQWSGKYVCFDDYESCCPWCEATERPGYRESEGHESTCPAACILNKHGRNVKIKLKLVR